MMNTTVRTRYTRRYADGEKVSSQDLMTAYQVAARLVAEHGDAYLPLFERLDDEVHSREKKGAVRERALQIAKAAARESTSTPPRPD